jgi:hypothetical protein
VALGNIAYFQKLLIKIFIRVLLKKKKRIMDNAHLITKFIGGFEPQEP